MLVFEQIDFGFGFGFEGEVGNVVVEVGEVDLVLVARDLLTVDVPIQN